MKVIQSTNINNLIEISLDKAQRNFLAGKKVYKSGASGTVRVYHFDEINSKEIGRRFFLGV